MAERTFGEASDFYRIRVIRVDETDTPEFEWRDDVLWRRHAEEPAEEYDVWRVDLVTIDDESARPLRAFTDPDSADEWVSLVREDLARMTKPEFDAAYVDPAEQAVAE